MAAVRSFDIRGVVGRDLDEGDARILGGAYASLAQERGLRHIGVGRDGRLTSPRLEAALLEGLVAGGMQVTRIGVGPTPQLAFAVRHLKLDGGIMVTASHNPPPENGFKSLLGSERIHGEALRALVARPARPKHGGSVDNRSVSEAYIAELAEAAPRLAPLKVAWDCSNGATGEIVERLVRLLPGEHVLLNTEIDGRFPAHHADPAVEANMRDLQRAVVGHGCDLGIAFDGDGDRIGAVDGSGAMVWADQLLLLLTSDLLRDHPGATVVADVKSSRVFFDGVAELGGRAVMVPSGYVLVRDAIREEGALLGGELSGHVFYNDGWDGTDDALYVAIRLLLALTRSGRSLAQFRAALPRTIVTPEFRIPCAGDRKAIVAEVGERLEAEGVEINRADGLRVTNPDGWWLLRASGTESKLTIRCESADEDGLERLMTQVRRHLRQSGIELG
jgi:phosphomannomutase